jgi:hypothetical protein
MVARQNPQQLDQASVEVGLEQLFEWLKAPPQEPLCLII